MFFDSTTSKKYQKRHLQFLFWTREYRRQAAYLYFKKNPDKLKEYTEDLQTALQYLHECYSLDAERFQKVVNAFFLQKMKLDKNNQNDDFFVLQHFKDNISIKLDNPMTSEFLLNELTTILLHCINYSNEEYQYTQYFNFPERYVEISNHAMRFIMLITDFNGINIDMFTRGASDELKKLFSFIPKGFSKELFNRLLEFHKTFGIFPLDLDLPYEIPKNESQKPINIAYFDDLIQNNKMKTNLARILTAVTCDSDKDSVLSYEDFIIAINTVLPMLSEESKDINYFVGDGKFVSEDNENYNYVYLSKSLFSKGSKHFKSILKIYPFSKTSKRGPTYSKAKAYSNFLSPTPTSDSLIQVQYSKDNEQLEKLLKQLELIFRKFKATTENNYHETLNSDELRYNGKLLQSTFSHCEDENEKKRIEKSINPKKEQTIPQVYEIENKSLPKIVSRIEGVDEEGRDCTYVNLDKNLKDYANSEEYKNIAKELSQNYNINSSIPQDLSLLVIEKEDSIVLAPKIYRTDAEQYFNRFENVADMKRASYTPKVHKGINEAQINIFLQTMEKSQVADAYRAGGLWIYHELEIEGKEYGDTLLNLSDVKYGKEYVMYFSSFDDAQFGMCVNLARCSIELKRALKIDEASKINKNHPKAAKFKYSTANLAKLEKLVKRLSAK